MSQERRGQLIRMMSDACSKNVKLIFFWPPVYTLPSKESLIESQLDSLASQYDNVTVINDAQDEYFLNHLEMFFDYIHLNGDGALVYSRQFASKVKDIINGNNVQ